MRTARWYGLVLVVLQALAAGGTAAARSPEPATAARARYIVESATSAAARARVDRVGGAVEQELAIVHGVAAYLNPWQVTRLRATAGVRLYEDRALSTDGVLNLLSPVTAPVVMGLSSTNTPQDGTGEPLPTLLYQTNYPMLVGADTLQQAGITGRGVAVAVLDSGLWQDPGQNYAFRILATRDVLNGGTGPVTGDPYGHGTHVTSIAAGGAMNIAGSYLGIAP
jgi:subtilisin family serine protease